MRTKKKSLDAAFDALSSHTSFQGKTFVDLGILSAIYMLWLIVTVGEGSGDGVAVIAAAKQGFAKVKGYEINPFLCAYPRINCSHSSW